MIMSEQVSLQERTSQEPAQEPQVQTEKYGTQVGKVQCAQICSTEVVQCIKR